MSRDARAPERSSWDSRWRRPCGIRERVSLYGVVDGRCRSLTWLRGLQRRCERLKHLRFKLVPCRKAVLDLRGGQVNEVGMSPVFVGLNRNRENFRDTPDVRNSRGHLVQHAFGEQH